MFHRLSRTIATATLLALPLLTLSANVGLTETEAVSFKLVNNTSRTLQEFYASPPSTSEWEQDILGVDVLQPGESTTITINDGRADCLYDFKGVLAAGAGVGSGELIQSSVSVCDGGVYEYSE